MLGITVARKLRRNRKIHHHTSAIVSNNVVLHISDRSPDGGCPISQNLDMHRGRQRRLQLRQDFLHAVHNADEFAPGCR